MLRRPDFLDKELHSPLIDSSGYIARERDSVIERSSSWCATVLEHAAGAEQTIDDLSEAGEINEETTRILIKDAERTFLDDKHRQEVVKVLRCVVSRLGDYHQGMGYVAGFLMLTLEPLDVAKILYTVGTCPRYIPRYWCHEAVAFGTDAYVFYRILKEMEPSVVNHISMQGVVPETFCQKWFVGLCVHVLPFEHLFTFFDLFIKEGFTASFKLGVALIRHLRERITKTKDIAVLYSLLRMDSKVVSDDDARAIVTLMNTLDLSGFNINGWRDEERTKIEERVRRAREIIEQESDSEFDFTDSEDEANEKD